MHGGVAPAISEGQAGLLRECLFREAALTFIVLVAGLGYSRVKFASQFICSLNRPRAVLAMAANVDYEHYHAWAA